MEGKEKEVQGTIQGKSKRKSKVSKEKKIKEPQYYTSATNMRTLNYKVYYMSLGEKVFYFLIGFAVGAAIGYLFYGGLAKDAYGEPTSATYILNMLISGAAGIGAGCAFIPIRTDMIQKTRTKKLKSQFRDMLEAFNTSLGAGKNVVDSFHSVYEDLKVQYEEDAYILKELEVILYCMANNVDLEVPLTDFGARSGVDDIVSFANVFKICYHKGGNIKDTIRNTQIILSDKMEIEEEIETTVTGARSEQYMMLVMPVLLIGMMKMMSADFAANFATLAGIIATTIGIVMFAAAYLVGRAVLNIKV
ncbi:MAG: hypothetical protein HFH82_13650 [Lachnospiraceae bacterium]|nr:hypothetical protein [Lachnospiraceae bacterium]